MVTLDFRNEQRLGNILGPKKNGENFHVFRDFRGLCSPLACQPQKNSAPGTCIQDTPQKFRGIRSAIRSDPSLENLPKIHQKEAGSSSRGCIRENERNLPQEVRGEPFL